MVLGVRLVLGKRAQSNYHGWWLYSSEQGPNMKANMVPGEARMVTVTPFKERMPHIIVNEQYITAALSYSGSTKQPQVQSYQLTRRSSVGTGESLVSQVSITTLHHLVIPYPTPRVQARVKRLLKHWCVQVIPDCLTCWGLMQLTKLGSAYRPSKEQRDILTSATVNLASPPLTFLTYAGC